ASIEVEPGVTAGDYLDGLYLGTREALWESRRDTITITVDAVTGHSVGALIALYERAVGLYAEMINVNAYHQPGVEAGKKAAAAVLQLESKILAYLKTAANPQTADEISAAVGQPERTEWIYKILKHLSKNASRGVHILDDANPADVKFST